MSISFNSVGSSFQGLGAQIESALSLYFFVLVLADVTYAVGQTREIVPTSMAVGDQPGTPAPPGNVYGCRRSARYTGATW